MVPCLDFVHRRISIKEGKNPKRKNMDKPVANWTKEIEQISHWIQIGQAERARIRLQEVLSCHDVPRGHVAAVANGCRRSGLLDFSLRLLTPIIRPKVRQLVAPSPEETAEYALALLPLGARREAVRLLEDLPQSENPDTIVYRAFCQISLWNYGQAKDLLVAYLAKADPTAYLSVVAKVNLLACDVSLQEFEGFENRILVLAEQLAGQGYNLLWFNVQELFAQFLVKTGRYQEAITNLEELVSRKVSVTPNFALFARKWQAVARLYLARPEDRKLGELINVRDEAEKLEHWETVRDCDFYRSLLEPDQELLLRVYFGTASPHYRKLIQKMVGQGMIPQSWDWRVGNSPRCFDLILGREVHDENIRLREGQAVYRTLVCLLADRYRPITVAGVFAEVYPDEYYNHETSPTRVHQAIRKLRDWLQESKIPVGIHLSKDGYRLNIEGEYAFRLSSGLVTGGDRSEDIFVHQLRRAFENRPFSNSDCQKLTGLSAPHVGRQIKQAMDLGFVERIGQGRSTLYVLKSAA